MANEVLFTVLQNEQVGRYAIANKTLKIGDLILSETPFAYGPKSDSPPVCLGCFSPVDCSTLCTKCSWPVCGTDCEYVSSHRNNECGVFAKARAKFQEMRVPTDVCLQYECIVPLRVLLAKEQNPQKWEEEVAVMEAHNDIRRTKPIWRFNQINIVNYLRGPCKLDRFPENLIHTVCGILEVNSFEARTFSGCLIRCLYPKLAVLSHSCVSNVHHSVAPEDFTVNVRAAVNVPENGELFSSYTYSLWPTLVRREFLKESKYFECSCERCKDPLELGTHMSTLKCRKCNKGAILSTDPLSFTCEWKCTRCKFAMNAVAVRKIYKIVQTEIDSVEVLSGRRGIEQREILLKKYNSILHRKNAYLTMLRVSLSQMYGIEDSLLQRKVDVCKELLEVLDVVEPGASRIRGIVLYELHAPLLILAKNQWHSADKEEYRKRLKEGVDVLHKSIEIMKNEFPRTAEGQMAVVAQRTFDNLRQNTE